MRFIELQGIKNVRDLGGIPIAGGRFVKSGLFFRGGALDKATLKDVAVLRDDLNIECIIDLRCGWERDAAPDAHIEGAENVHIPFYDKEIVGLEYTEPEENTKVVGRDIACNPMRFYPSLANPLTCAQMKKALDRVFEFAVEGRPVYQHCSGGKDRTGVLSLLTLMVLGAEMDDIIDDYLYTNLSRDKDYDALYARFLKLACGDEGLAAELVESHRAKPEYLHAFCDAVAENYGSMEEFMSSALGFDAFRRERICQACTQSAPSKSEVPPKLILQAVCTASDHFELQWYSQQSEYTLSKNSSDR